MAEPAYRALAADDPRKLPGVRVVFAREPAGDLSPFWSYHHRWSLALLEALRDAFPDGGPDLVEFNDYWGEGAMTVEGRRSLEPLPRRDDGRRADPHDARADGRAQRGRHGLLERTMHGLERCALRGADVVLWPGGDVWGTYRRFYTDAALAPARRVPEPFLPPPADDADRAAPRRPLRLLYVGRLERRKGVEDLVDAVTGLEGDDVALTLVGGDTDTAPDGGSMRRWLTARAAGDPRIAFRDRVPHDELRALMRDHHVVVSPSRWESWSNVVREALAGNRPVLATPVGGVVDAIEPGRTGWLTDDASPAALRAGIEELRERRDEIARLIADGAPRAGLEAQLDHEGLVAAYLRAGGRGRSLPGRSRPGDRRLRRSRPSSPRTTRWGALERSLAALRRSPVPVRVVLASADGLPPLRLGQALADAVLVPSHQQAFHAALRHARGDGLVLLLDARDELDAAFLPRALAALAADPALAYVSALPAGRVASPPLPNAAAATIGEGIGSGAMLVRRADLEAVGIPDRQYGDPLAATAVALAALNRWGTVIPEPLVRTSARRAQPPVDEWYPARVMPPALWLPSPA